MSIFLGETKEIEDRLMSIDIEKFFFPREKNPDHEGAVQNSHVWPPPASHESTVLIYQETDLFPRIPRLIGQTKRELFGDGGFCFFAEPEVEGETVAEAQLSQSEKGIVHAKIFSVETEASRIPARGFEIF
jgi:hypothetical protein